MNAKLIQREPTPEMMYAGWRASDNQIRREEQLQIFYAMWDAAPQVDGYRLPEFMRRAIERAIEDSRCGMQLNDGKQRVTLPGGTLEYLLRLLDAAALSQSAKEIKG